MKLTTKGRFAVTAMVDLAMASGSRPVTLAQISERQKISLSYLEQLFGKLRRSGLVTSVRGPGGGYHLARPTAEISVSDVIVAVDEPIDSTQCDGMQNCRDNQKCITHDLWVGLNAHIASYMKGVSLKQLVDAQEAQRRGEAQVEAPVRDMREAGAANDTVLAAARLPMQPARTV